MAGEFFLEISREDVDIGGCVLSPRAPRWFLGQSIPELSCSPHGRPPTYPHCGVTNGESPRVGAGLSFRWVAKRSQ